MGNDDQLNHDIGDLIRQLSFSPAKSAPPAEEPAIQDQVRDPTEQELADLRTLAVEAAALQDELKALVGDRDRRLRALRDQLKGEFLRFGLTRLDIAGRGPIELTCSNSRKPTRKSLVEAAQRLLVAQMGEEKRAEAEAEGKKRVTNLWNAIEPTPSYGISIPDPTPSDPESPY